MTRARRVLSTLLLCGLARFASGCMTIEHLLDAKEDLRMYGGTIRSNKYMEDGSNPRWGVALRIIDLPFTVVADTVLLPVTAPVESLRD
jgi:uncharacterized protein YceK